MPKKTDAGPPAERGSAPMPLSNPGGLVLNQLEPPQSPTLPSNNSQQLSVEGTENHFSRWELSWKSDPSDHNCSGTSLCM